MAAIEVDGYRELQRALRQATDRDIPKRMGEAHKEIGRFVISRLQPRPQPEAVGSGSRATVRPSASKREVLLRVGGAHRAHTDAQVTRMRQWGQRTVEPFREAPPRPHIIGTARREQPQIVDRLREQIVAALRSVGEVS